MSITFNDVYRFPYPSNNTTLQTVVQSLSNPTGLAVDSANDHIYWTDDGTYRLSRCNLDGSNATMLSTFIDPWVIRLDVTNRHELKLILHVLPYIVDTDEQRLYWINYNGDMKSAKDDGSDVKTILSTTPNTHYYAIGVVGSYIYYANNNQLLMVNKTPGSTPTVLYNDANSIHSIFVFIASGM
ncbi:LRP2 [Mytilus coruscus]|uniref:LRP2 n=1 Tax=Mytilus coruscus TaxID=42192 RepID=A0A6J8B5F9_MYTCO|nr:LRP2 [Mytilus coruscus]